MDIESPYTEEETGQRVKVLVADFSRDDVYMEIEDNLKDLEIGVLGKDDLWEILIPQTVISYLLPKIMGGKQASNTHLDPVQYKLTVSDVCSLVCWRVFPLWVSLSPSSQ